MPTVLALAAHPDDIEYMMAGTLLRLRACGWTAHYFNLCSGNCGSLVTGAAETAAVRLQEAHEAAALLGATFHPPIADDLELVYSVPMLRRVTAVVRAVNPSIVLTHAPVDYMEDHMMAGRLAVTAAFSKNIPNFRSDPEMGGAPGDVAVYHAMPHGLRGPLRERIEPDVFVDTTAVHEVKLAALGCHRSQQGWLAASQGMNSYLQAMDDMSREMGRRSGRWLHAEGWRRHLHLGLSQSEWDPLGEALEGRLVSSGGATA